MTQNKVLMSRLKEAREDRGMSQAELARKVGLSKSAICLYEAGKHTPSIQHSHAIADALNVSYNWLIGYSEYRYKIEANHLSEVYLQLSDERKKELYNFAEYLKRKDEDDEGIST